MEKTIQEAVATLTASDIAAKTGLNVSTAYRLKSGKARFVSAKVAGLIMNAFGVDLTPFVFNPKEQRRAKRHWSRAARLRVKRRNRAKKAWRSRKAKQATPTLKAPAFEVVLVNGCECCHVFKGGKYIGNGHIAGVMEANHEEN